MTPSTRPLLMAMSLLISLITAFQFLTILPPISRREIELADLGRAVGWFPLVGLAIGAFLAAFHWGLSQLFPPGIVAVFTLGSWILASGAIHFDGFLDSCDGLFGGRTPERRLEIMRDHRVGAFAVAGGGLLLLLKYNAILALPQATMPLLLAPMLGRWSIAMAIVFFPYARKEGLGRAMKDHAHWPQALQATTIAVLAAAILGGGLGILTMLIVGFSLLLAIAFIQRRIPGLTGDSYGALCELMETVALLAMVAIA